MSVECMLFNSGHSSHHPLNERGDSKLAVQLQFAFESEISFYEGIQFQWHEDEERH